MIFFKLKKNILFRKYSDFGYLADNFMFGYRALNDSSPVLPEKYVSLSGAVMLELLSREFQSLDVIVEKLLNIFVDVDYLELKQDILDFFMLLVNEGYLNCSESDEMDTDIIDNFQTKSCDDNQINKNFAFNNIEPVTNGIDSINLQNNFLRSIHVEITNVCNEYCVHCYFPSERINVLMKADVFEKIILEGRKMNIINVTLSGGEPLTHPNFIGFLKMCRELDLSVNVLTNLTLLTDEIVSEMRKNPLLSVQTSIYSMDVEVHDSITHLSGSLEKTKTAVSKLIQANIPVQISCPVMKQNKDSFVDVVHWSETKNLPVLVNYTIFATYDRSNSNLVNRLSPSEIAEAFASQLSTDYIKYFRNNAIKKCALSGDVPICTVCRYYFCISATGDVFPCVGWQNKILGNINKISLEEIWEKSAQIQYLRQIKWKDFPKCLHCKDRGYCTVCMMKNANENVDGDIFRINDFHCKVAEKIHAKIDTWLE